ncbi:MULTISPECIES: hypothetical protein [Acetobacter]|uniref:Uncharacterized protein n=1 Tax=Acetobacter ascendens TaxID=481146 RepID=A0A1Y0V1P7_9PROT|nr:MULTISPECIES: hypothetical protein [Acetobacter]ARW12082.1 hypothetical protein S101447_03045 [Acetobacter ascendens]KAA8383754.1 hypothetical protein FKW31_14265 [Acetobacter sp. DmW_136]
MAIGNVVQKGSWVHVYDERGHQLTVLNAGNGKDDGLTGYTGSTVNIRRGAWIYTFNEKGKQISVTSAR